MPPDSGPQISLLSAPSTRFDHRHKGPYFAVLPLGLENLTAALCAAGVSDLYKTINLAAINLCTSHCQEFTVPNCTCSYEFYQRTEHETRTIESLLYPISDCISVALIGFSSNTGPCSFTIHPVSCEFFLVEEKLHYYSSTFNEIF